MLLMYPCMQYHAELLYTKKQKQKNTSGSFERDVGALRGFSSERQESSLGNESGEKTKEEGVDNT